MSYSNISLNYSLVCAGALGALGRRFESFRPDSNNPSHASEFPRLAFLLENLTAAIAVKLPSNMN